MVSKRPKKHTDIVALVKKCVTSGRFYDTRHATNRKGERAITLLEIQHVFENGFHEKKKDEFKPEFNAWNYAIRGKTVDGRSLRVAVSFESGKRMVIITAIDLEK